ncbi:trypsin-like peptidase domain-containing protein [Pseudonocardia spirodelae]|uniref:Trypsin-like peptidase domain-containing protein n=1 Tax=Pseudonocardia spirodelae TaxID=3133431 RepID=A0ABU8TDZ6_9PSEU
MTQDDPPEETTRTGAGTPGGTGRAQDAPADAAREDDAAAAPAGPAASATGSGPDGAGSAGSGPDPAPGADPEADVSGPATPGPDGAGGTRPDTTAHSADTAGPAAEGSAAADPGPAPGPGADAPADAGAEQGQDVEAVSTQDPPTDRWPAVANPWARPGSTAAAQDAPAAPSGATPSGSAAGTTPTAVYADGAAGDGADGATAVVPADSDGAGPPPWAAGATTPPPRAPGRGRRAVVLVAAGLLVALVAGALGGVIGARIAGGSAAAAGPGSVEAVAAKVLPAVVQIRVDGGAGNVGDRGEGSGMIIAADGLILTNNHVVAPAAQGGTLRVVLQDGRAGTGTIVGQDPQSDIALVRTDLPGLQTVELGDSDAVRVGQQVTAFGSPLGLGGSVTTGIVSAVDRAVGIPAEAAVAGGEDTVLNAIQTDAAINPGNSGGPLVDADGRVVGINSAIATAGPGGGSIGVGFSIPVNQARRIADQLRDGGRATHAVLGVTVGNDPELRGAVIQEVTPGGAAAQAGLRPQEIVARLGDQRTTTGTDLQAAVRSQPPGSVVQLEIVDASGAGRTVQVTLGEQ